MKLIGMNRAPSFVGGERLDLDKTIEVDEDVEEIGGGDSSEEDEDEGSDEDAEGEDADEEESSDEVEQPPEPRVREESPEPAAKGGLGLGMSNGGGRPGLGMGARSGIGMAGAKSAAQGFASASSTSQVNDISLPKASRAGIGSASSKAPSASTPSTFKLTNDDATSFTDAYAIDPSIPTSFGKGQSTRSTNQRAFAREEKTPVTAPIKPAHLTAADKLAFASLRGSIGQRMMAKMGYTEVCQSIV